MNRLKQLTREINELTSFIEEEYPELYRYLDENPISIPTSSHPQMDTENFADYLESLREILKRHIENTKSNV